jgi:hypothetical protein
VFHSLLEQVGWKKEIKAIIQRATGILSFLEKFLNH